MKRIFALLLAVCLLFCGCTAGEKDSRISAGEENWEQGYGLQAAVLYWDGSAWEDAVSYLRQGMLLGLTVTPLQAAEDMDLSGYDLVYLDESLLRGKSVADRLMDYTQQGGTVVVPNSLRDYFPLSYLGAVSFEKISGFCRGLKYPKADPDLKILQEMVRDFSGIYEEYEDFPLLSSQDYGWGMRTDTAQALVKQNGLALYTVNRVGEGQVFFLNPMLPNTYSLGSLTMDGADAVSAYSNTTSSFNRLFLGEIAAYTAKCRYGYALERVFGYFGTPSMSWECHYEEITGIENDSLILFSQLCQEANQIPSFTLVRNSYTWFLRAESVTSLLNQADGDFAFSVDFYDGAYSCGTHVESGGTWLQLAREQGSESYFDDYPDTFTCRAFPAVTDYDGDGKLDLFCGSKDGGIYYFPGAGFRDGRLRTGQGQPVMSSDGTALQAGAYSAPKPVDVDGDRMTDLVCGSQDGLLRWFRGDGSGAFTPEGVLLDHEVPGQALPAFGDANGDGIPDLAVGSDQGTLMVYYGAYGKDGSLSYSHGRAVNLSWLCANGGLGKWLSPAFVDWNGDGIQDLAVGVYQGYIAILLGQADGTYEIDGYIQNREWNYKGNANLKFGNYCTPVFYDLNGDGSLDLCCGSQEYGMAYPIDSPEFPFREKLQGQIDYAEQHDIYVGLHFYTNSYASAEREQYELAAQKAAMVSYGMDVEDIGANQHTWATSSLGSAQTMNSLYQAGLLWQSGYGAPGANRGSPQNAAEAVVTLPHYLMNGGETTNLLVQNCSILLFGNQAWQALAAKYQSPVSLFCHPDFVYRSQTDARNKIDEAARFQQQYRYNFNREDQMMRASAAALNQTVAVSGSLAEGITISPGCLSADFPLYDQGIQSSLGVRVELSARVDPETFRVGSDVWFRDGNAIVMSLNRPAQLTPGAKNQGSHLTRVNMAAEISTEEQGAEVRFLSGGMMQAAVEGDASTSSEGWTVTKQDGQTIFTKFGSNESLKIQFEKEEMA